jgi:hypothetical protein
MTNKKKVKLPNRKWTMRLKVLLNGRMFACHVRNPMFDPSPAPLEKKEKRETRF